MSGTARTVQSPENVFFIKAPPAARTPVTRMTGTSRRCWSPGLLSRRVTLPQERPATLGPDIAMATGTLVALCITRCLRGTAFPSQVLQNPCHARYSLLPDIAWRQQPCCAPNRCWRPVIVQAVLSVPPRAVPWLPLPGRARPHNGPSHFAAPGLVPPASAPHRPTLPRQENTDRCRRA